MKIAIAVEQKKHPRHSDDYIIWYMVIHLGKIIRIDRLNRFALIKDIFEDVKRTGCSQWKAYVLETQFLKTIEIFDFLSLEKNCNTHFGNLPPISAFQDVLNLVGEEYELCA